MSQATVTAVTGNAVIVKADGTTRALQVGEVVQRGDVIRTQAGARVELLLADGQIMAMGPNQAQRVDESVALTDATPQAADAAVQPTTVAEIVQILEQGLDLLEQVDPAAAGAVAAGAGEGSDFVRLLRVTEPVDPLAFQFNAAAADVDDVIEGALTSLGVTVSDSATATIVDNDVPTVLVGAPGTGVGDITVPEGDLAVFGVRINNAAAGSTLVLTLADGTALSPDDYSADAFQYSLDNGVTWSDYAGAIDLPAGDSTLQVRTSTVDDLFDENDETFTLGAALTSVGATVSDSATATIVDNDTKPTIAGASACVSEEGLANGITDTTGTQDTTDSASAIGNITFTGNGSAPLTVALTVPSPPTTTIGGTTLTWSHGTNAAVLIGSSGATQVIQITLNGGNTAVATGATSVSYTVTLLQPIQHPINSVEDVLSLSVGLSISDGVNPPDTGSITVTIEDDMPVIASADDLTLANQVTSQTGNINGLLFGADGPATLQALRLSGWPDLPGITENLSADGKTLTATIDGSGTPPKVFYTLVLSDSGSYTFNLVTPQPTQTIAIGSQFGAGGPVETIAVNAGANVVTFDGLLFSNVGGVATPQKPGTGSGSDDLNPNANGFGIQNGNLDHNEGFRASMTSPADGLSFTVVRVGNVDQVTVEWRAYAADGMTVVDAGTLALSGLRTADQLALIQSDAEFSHVDVRFVLVGNESVRIQDFSVIDRITPPDLALGFVVTATDRDGDAATANLTVNLTNFNYSATGNDLAQLVGGGDGADNLNAQGGNDVVYGGAGNDTLSGGDGNDLLLGGADNDILTGGLGADVFAWRLGDQGSTGTPARDVITDFNPGQGDALDLRDLLQGETAANLGTYLRFGTEGTGAGARLVLQVDHDGGGSFQPTQHIVFDNFASQAALAQALGMSGTTSEADILNKLRTDGHLLTD